MRICPLSRYLVSFLTISDCYWSGKVLPLSSCDVPWIWKVISEWVQSHIHKEKRCSQMGTSCWSQDINQFLPRISSAQTYFVTQQDFMVWYRSTVVRLTVFGEPDKLSLSREHYILWLGSSFLQDVWKRVIFLNFFWASSHMILFWCKMRQLYCPCFTLNIRMLVQWASLFFILLNIWAGYCFSLFTHTPHPRPLLLCRVLFIYIFLYI